MFFGRNRKNEEENPNAEEVEQASSKVAREFYEGGKKEGGKYTTCPVPWCKSGLVYPVERTQLNDFEWKVLLLCPNCWYKREVMVERETVRKLLKAARMGKERIMKDLDIAKKKHMEEEADAFALALSKDHILPEDFALSAGTNPNEGWIKSIEREGK